jgi:hypothetical protein
MEASPFFRETRKLAQAALFSTKAGFWANFILCRQRLIPIKIKTVD